MRNTIPICWAIALGLWTFVAEMPPVCAAPATAPGARVVVDHTGTPVTLPAEINRIAVTCYGGASHELTVLGGASRIVAQPSIDRFPLLAKIHTPFAQVPDAGSFNEVNLETILALRPDVVLAGVTAAQGNERIQKLGIPVVVLGTGHADIDSLLKEFVMVGEILDATDIAAELVNYWKTKLALIHARTASIAEKDKKRVFYGSNGPPFRIEGGRWWGHHFIHASGGMNVAADVQIKGGVSPEQLMIWNPDVLITSVNIGEHGTTDDIRVLPEYRTLSAVKNNAIHACPVGAFWWDRPSPEAILGILWLAKTLYPDQMTDINIQDETMHFYSRFYRYNLTEDEFHAFFSDGAKKKRTP